MHCEVWRVGDGAAIVCYGGRARRRRRCSVCQKHVADKLCDGKPAGGRKGTCDAPLCACCARTRPDPKKKDDTLDFCPRHADQAPPAALLP